MVSFIIFSLILFATPVLADSILFDISLNPTSDTKDFGISTSSTFTISNLWVYEDGTKKDGVSVSCDIYQGGSKVTTKTLTSSSSTAQSTTYQATLSTPSSGDECKQQTQSIGFYAFCKASWTSPGLCTTFWACPHSANYTAPSITFSLTYPTQTTVTKCQQKNSANQLISDAQTAIVNAQSKIQEAGKLCASIDLTTANSYLTTANTALQNAQTFYNQQDYSSAITQAQNAKTNADSAKTTAEGLITQFGQKKTEAQNKINTAFTAIDTAKSMAKKADDIISNATLLGLDTIDAQTNVKSARAKLESAQTYYTESQTAFDQCNFDLAKEKATFASTYAKDVEDLANKAYSSLSTALSIGGEASKAILSAGSEISQTDEVLTKMNYIIRGVEKWNVDLGEAKIIASTGQSNIDQAKDLLAQARNRFQAGKYTEAATTAIQARDKAAEPTNRLGRIVDSMSIKTQDALEKAYSDANTKITSAESAVKDAQNTYAATQSEIIAAQNDLATAKSQLANASTAINEIKSATDLTSFVTKASLAFSALDDVNNKVNSAIAHANAAKMGLVTTVVLPAAGAAAAVGGGFLYWRRLKKKPKIVKEIAKEVEKVEEKVEEVVEGKPKKHRKKRR